MNSLPPEGPPDPLPLRTAFSSARRLGALLLTVCALPAQPPLAGTDPLITNADLSVEMVHGIARFLDREIAAAAGQRAQFWQPDFSSRGAYEKSVTPNRDRLGRMLGVVDPRTPGVEMELVATVDTPATIAETSRFLVHAVRWRAFDSVYGEALLLRPKEPVVARVIAVPDADQTPELVAGLQPGLQPEQQYARRLAENGCEVIVPVLIDRSDEYSGNPAIRMRSNFPHREHIYRQAYVQGRHVIGIEVQKLRSAIDWFAGRNEAGRTPIGLVGWGEGGLLAFYTAALDTRVDATLVSGYFGPREELWREPMYRNVFGLLREFGDAELAQLILPRALLIEPADAPRPKPSTRPDVPREPAAAGRLAAPTASEVAAEVERARRLARSHASSLLLLDDAGSRPPAGTAVLRFLQSLRDGPAALRPPAGDPVDRRVGFDERARQHRQIVEAGNFLQRLIPLSATVRDEFLWKKVPPKSPEAWRDAMRDYRMNFWNDHIGRFDRSAAPLRPRSRQIHDEPRWTGYEVVIDVFPDVHVWAYYLLPKDLKPGERRPVVVTQHGGVGVPADVITENTEERGYRYYKAFARRLVERGFIVLAPHILTGGHDRLPNRPSMKMLHRRANSIGRTVTSISVAQHDALLDWLASRPEVDPQRIAFYGLSYGGKAAMRIPSIVEKYALSICSADFNEWVWKTATTDYRNSNVFNLNFDVQEFDLGSTFNYAEMAALIAPRPFMVERGHDDGVSIDEQVAFEYAKVRRLYAKLGIPERTEIEFFNGPHTINGVGTFKFLHRHLNWPEPEESTAPQRPSSG